MLLLPDSRGPTLGRRPALAAGHGGHEIGARNQVRGGREGDPESAEKWWVLCLRPLQSCLLGEAPGPASLSSLLSGALAGSVTLLLSLSFS